ncbi:MAG: radical SAM protein, partial [Mycobacterium sp.]
MDTYTSRHQGVSHQPESAEAGTTVQEPYFLGLNRAMVSLGPLTDSVYCTFKCKFCYVNGPYQKYARRTVDEILDWLYAARDKYDIIYVSGDTDSFAKPRTHDGLGLLSELTALKSDVLFTTRHVFSGQEREELQRIISAYAAIGKLFIPCISVSQLRHPALEPPPIASPEDRLEQIRWFHDNGAKVILTVRPFLPYIP